VVQQQTVREPVQIEGVGLHTGQNVKMTILPAEPNSGIRFRRVDLEGEPEIEATITNVVETTRCTTLGKGNIRIHTVEHILATLYGLGITNAVICLDAPEPPVGDGSARDFTRAILEAGLQPQSETIEPFEIYEPIQLQIGESFLSVFSHDRLRISCTSADRKGLHTQFRTLEVTPETFQTELSKARTFCFFEEIEPLIRKGLIRGGSLRNAIVVREDAVLTTEPLRYPDEFVRHKILDLLGDLALLGRPLIGHVVAMRPSHTANCELVRRLREQMLRPVVAQQAFLPPVEKKEPAREEAIGDVQELVKEGATLDISQILRILPHRYPFLMVDRVVRIEGKRITAIKQVTINEPYFQGHFPTHPVMPGVLQLEAIAQVAGILMLRHAGSVGKLAYFMSAESVKWRKPVRPGDTLTIEVELIKARGRIGRARGRCLVDGETVSEAEVTFMLVESQSGS